MSLLSQKERESQKPTEVTKEEVLQGIQVWGQRIKWLNEAIILAKDAQFVLREGLKTLEQNGHGNPLELTYVPRYLPRETHEEYFNRIFANINRLLRNGASEQGEETNE